MEKVRENMSWAQPVALKLSTSARMASIVAFTSVTSLDGEHEHDSYFGEMKRNKWPELRNQPNKHLFIDFYPVRDIKPPNNQFCFPQFFSVWAVDFFFFCKSKTRLSQFWTNEKFVRKIRGMRKTRFVFWWFDGLMSRTR